MATIAFLGDTLLGDQFQAVVRQQGYHHALAGLAPLLARANLTVANLEGVLTAEDRGLLPTPHRRRYWMRGDPESAPALAAHGIRLVSLANNHTLDYGLDGLSDTLTALEAHGIERCGAGLTEAAARAPVILTIGGMRFGFLSCIQQYDLYADWLYAGGTFGGCNRLSQSTLDTDLPRLAAMTDIAIPLVHWGRNYRDVTPAQERWAPRLAAAGANLIVGHHPHIAQRVAVIDGCPVIYSLGNGAFGTRGRFAAYDRTPYGLVALAEFVAPGRLAALELHVIDVDNRRTVFQPAPVPGELAIPFLRGLTSESDGWRDRGAALRLELQG